MKSIRAYTGKAPKCLCFLLPATTTCVVAAALLTGCSGSSGSGTPQSVANGPWGNTNAELAVTSTTITFSNGCGKVTLTGPATLNSANEFVLTGPFPSNLPYLNEKYSGLVNGSAMQLVVTDPGTGASLASYNLTQGVTQQSPIGMCP